MSYQVDVSCSSGTETKQSFEVVNFKSAPTEFGPSTTYRLAFKYKIAFKPASVVLLGTNGDWASYSCDSIRSHSVFGVYYALIDPLTGLDFDPTSPSQFEREAVNNVDSIPLPTLSFVPSAPNPPPNLIWSIQASVDTDL